ncbi:hypothetical protein [Ruminococcus flavefaciens]|uniref:hypothetical protein n=1 Tax=Ruminococcus flavefaciens TaxID=1265 RepID=UPI0002F2F530|nr:hypothetical protein [Ruminococcus flavefaciens]
MLQEKIDSTIGLIDDVVYNRSIANENANVAKRNSSFFDSLEKLTPTIQSYILSKKNFDFDVSDSLSIKIHDLMNYSKETFHNSKAVNPDSFRKKCDSFIVEITTEWLEYYKKAHHELLSGLNIMIPVHSNPMIVRNCVANIKKCEKWPLTVDAVNSYLNAKQQANELLMEMHFDDDIKLFLQKVTLRTATLADLTPQILEWINTENIADKISLSIKGVQI